ncbi:hypothetical protein [Bacillus sp. SJS]|uniref:hypothetical protein n=1 Tax=Bacillus sp. SJS TaxID=1423321 RepID=UPI0004DD1962|nr:hypothetical protein [Bacillus sp. SJS]KZZ85067.1 hypothetical protein AS29_008445 [Bacillus sp. SJS]
MVRSGSAKAKGALSSRHSSNAIHFLKRQNLNVSFVRKAFSNAVEAKPDLLLLEPFILEDNGEVVIDRTHNGVKKMHSIG